MNYDKLIETISEIVNNDLIYKDGLSLIYTLGLEQHKKLSEHFFYKINKDQPNNYEYTKDFVVELGGILIKFVVDEEK